MTTFFSKALLTAAVMALAGGAQAQALKFSANGKPNDLDAVAMRDWADYITANSDLEVDVFDSASIVEQGKISQALARGTVDGGLMSPAWMLDQLPKWTILETPYLLSGPEHICAFHESDLWGEIVQDTADKMGAVYLDTVYQGTRTLNLRKQKDIQTPADMAGMSIRVVPSPTNILMGEGLGGNPTPVPFSELYLALQTGTVDAEENPLTLIYSQKFYEVTEQIVNTRHKVLIQFPAISKRTWDRLSDEQKQVVSDGAMKAMDSYGAAVVAQEAELQAKMEAEGLVFTDPDRDAFRNAMLDKFRNSELAADWEEGMFDRIATMEIPESCKAMAAN